MHFNFYKTIKLSLWISLSNEIVIILIIWRFIFFFCPQCHRPYVTHKANQWFRYIYYFENNQEFVYRINNRIQIDIIQPTSGTILYPADLPFLVFPDFSATINETDASAFADWPEENVNHFIKILYTVYISYTFRNA